MKISKAELRILVKHFKELVEVDIVGITATDARSAVGDWLMEVGQAKASQDFERLVHNYQTSPKIRKMQEKYDNVNSGW